VLDPTRFLELKYETFCEQPLETCRQVLQFVDLQSSPRFERDVVATPIKNTSHRWREGLTVPQQHLLDNLLRDDLVRYGYHASRTGETIPGAVAS
jgi:hypothetical protein